MAALVEVHEEEELKAAVASGTRVMGVNNRDLNTFGVDLGMHCGWLRKFQRVW